MINKMLLVVFILCSSFRLNESYISHQTGYRVVFYKKKTQYQLYYYVPVYHYPMSHDTIYKYSLTGYYKIIDDTIHLKTYVLSHEEKEDVIIIKEHYDTLGNSVARFQEVKSRNVENRFKRENNLRFYSMNDSTIIMINSNYQKDTLTVESPGYLSDIHYNAQ